MSSESNSGSEKRSRGVLREDWFRAQYMGSHGAGMLFRVIARDFGREIVLSPPTLERPDPLPLVGSVCALWFREYEGEVVVQVRSRMGATSAALVAEVSLEAVGKSVGLIALAASREIPAYAESETKRHVDALRLVFRSLESRSAPCLLPWFKRVGLGTGGYQAARSLVGDAVEVGRTE